MAELLLRPAALFRRGHVHLGEFIAPVPGPAGVGDLTNSRAVIDACRPWHWRDKFPKVNVPTPEERRMAQEKFGHLFEA